MAFPARTMTEAQGILCWRDLNGSSCNCPKCYGCRRKKDYNQRDATLDAKKLNDPKVRGKRQARAKAYNCPWCDYWHVGHDNKLVPLWKQNRSKYGNRK